MSEQKRQYIAVDLNNAENKVMPILFSKRQNIANYPKNIGITNQFKP